MKIKISTDSTADIPAELCEKYNISVLPLPILIDGKEHYDGIDITTEQMYKVLEAAKELPTTSQVSIEQYSELYTRIWKEGYTDLVHTTINSKGSGTYQAAVLSRNLFYEEHPEAKDFHIHLIDSMTYSMGYGMAVVEGAQLAEQGADAEAVAAHIREFCEHSRPVFISLDLKCVKKSGRVSPAAAFVGDALGLKPMFSFEDGEAKILSKARGEANAIKALVDLCMKERKPHTSYVIVHGNNDEAAAKLREAVAAVIDQPPMADYYVGCVISIHTGPNMIGILYRK